MKIAYIAIGVIIGVFIAANNPELASQIRHVSTHLFYSAASIISHG